MRFDFPIAYRLRRGDYWPFARDVMRKGEAKAGAILYKLYKDLMGAVDPKSERYLAKLADNEGHDELTRLELAADVVQEGYKDANGSFERHPFDLDVSVTVREYRGSLYAIPYARGVMRTTLNFLARDPRLEKFGYWSHSDRPRSVTAKEWAERAKVWSALGDERRWHVYSVIEVVSYPKFYRLNPYVDLFREAHQTRPLDGIVVRKFQRKQAPPPV